jgi:signal transduction histidine kinase
LPTEVLQTAARDGRYEGEGWRVRKDGSRFWASVTISSIHDPSGSLIGFAKVTRDITEQRAAQEALEDVNQELKAFSYTVSHDLRAPLRAMEGFAAILLDEFGDKLGEEGQRYAQRIVDAGTRMEDLIQGLLAYSHVASSDLPLQRVGLASLVEKVATELREGSEYAAARIEVARIEVRPPFPAVRANPTVLRQIISNLLSNAVKFVPKDRVPEVSMWSEPQGAYVRLWVEDNGIGIAPEHESQIFNVFQRLHGPAAYPGTGIGLAIVRKGAERMGGQSGVISEPGHGSRFWVDLPKAEGEG